MLLESGTSACDKILRRGRARRRKRASNVRSGAGTKVFASLHQVVAFEVDGYDPSEASAWSVVVHGVASDIHETNEALRAMTLPLFPWQAGPKPRFIRIEPTEKIGRAHV